MAGRLRLVLIACAGLAVTGAPVQAGDETFDTPSGAKVPRWAMLGKSEVNARNGPSLDNRVLWTYHKPGLPVQIISETREWRLICDPAGGVAWVKRTMLRSARNVITAPQRLELRSRPQDDAEVRAIARPRVLAQLDKPCKDGWCRISVSGKSGWIPQDQLWGVQDRPVCARPDMVARH